MNQAFLGLGTNLGNRESNLHAALARLQSLGISVLQISPIYETEPEGYLDQGLFLNAVVEIETDLPPHELLMRLKAVEAEMGREKTVPNGPRIIDLDILFYEALVLETPELQIPHPRLRTRQFVLAPLADIAPAWCDPVTGLTVLELLRHLQREK